MLCRVPSLPWCWFLAEQDSVASICHPSPFKPNISKSQVPPPCSIPTLWFNLCCPRCGCPITDLLVSAFCFYSVQVSTTDIYRQGYKYWIIVFTPEHSSGRWEEGMLWTVIAWGKEVIVWEWKIRGHAHAAEVCHRANTLGFSERVSWTVLAQQIKPGILSLKLCIPQIHPLPTHSSLPL